MKKELKFTGVNYHQGDSQFFRIDGLPKNLKKIEKRYIAASERSGSFHALFGNYDMFETEDGGTIVDVKEDCILNHSLKSILDQAGITMDIAQIIEKKDHRHTVIPKGVYFVSTQQRFDPLAGIKKMQKD